MLTYLCLSLFLFARITPNERTLPMLPSRNRFSLELERA